MQMEPLKGQESASKQHKVMQRAVLLLDVLAWLENVVKVNKSAHGPGGPLEACKVLMAVQT